MKFFIETNYILVHSFNTVYVKNIRRDISVMSRYTGNTALKTGKNGTVFVIISLPVKISAQNFLQQCSATAHTF